MVVFKILVVLLILQVTNAELKFVAKGMFPYHAYLTKVRNHGSIAGCDGALIKENYAITTASCLNHKSTDKWMIVIGEIFLRRQESRAIPITDVIIHNNFTHNDTKNDVALVKLKQKVKLSENVNFVHLNENDANINHHKFLILTGYEKLRLKYSLVHNVDKESCEEQLMNKDEYYLMYKSQLRVIHSHNQDTRDIFRGKVLAQYDNQKFTLVGLVTGNNVNVTSISSYIDWINNAIMSTPPMILSFQSDSKVYVKVTDREKFPYHVIIAKYTDGKIIGSCEGALIRKDYVLTTASCLTMMKTQELLVVIGDLTLDGNHEQIIPISDIFIHDGYSVVDTKDDIAIVKLTREVEENKFVKVIDLPTSNTIIKANENITAIGYKKIIEDDLVKLRFLNVRTKDRISCEEQLKKREKYNLLHDWQLCVKADDFENLDNAGYSDTLIQFNGSKQVLIGIITQNNIAASQVSMYDDWIKAVTKIDSPYYRGQL